MKQILIIIFFCITSLVSFSQEQTLYWIGGSGNWNDLTHWSTQSGSIGVQNPSSVPNAEINVIFDSGSGLSSGRIINISGVAAIAKSITITNDLNQTNSPIFNGSAITVNANITLNPFVVFNSPLISNPGLGQTALLKLNQAQITNFTKNLRGISTIESSSSNVFNITINSGELNYLPSTISLNNITINEGFVSLSNVLELNINDFRGGVNGSIEFKSDVIVNANNWTFIGNVDAPFGEFIISGAEFQNSFNNVYNKVVFNSQNTTILGSVGTCSFNELILNGDKITVSPGKSISANKITAKTNTIFEFVTGGSFTVGESFEINSVECNSFFKLTSTSGINFVNSSGSTLTINNLIAESVSFSSTNFTLVNGINFESMGNVSFNYATANNFYWIGSANDNLWNNPLNWSLSSGGSPGSCVPSPVDNVFFNDLSIINDEIIISQHEAYANNVTITSLINFSITGLPISIRGSWFMNENKTIESNVIFKSILPEQLITSNGSSFANVTFKGTGGWLLQDDFSTSENNGVVLRAGTLNTNNKNVFIGGDFNAGGTSLPNFNRNLILGSSEFSVNKIFDFLMKNGQNTYNFNAGTSHIILRNGTYFGTNSQVFNNVTVNDASANNIGNVFIENDGNPTFNNLVIYSKSVDFRRTYHVGNVTLFANSIKITPVSNSPNVRVFTNLELNSFEIGPSSNLSVLSNLNFKVNNSFSANTPDCATIMEFFVMSGTFFNFSSQNDVTINNAFLVGVHADTSTNATYSISGVLGENTLGFELIPNASKNLYWIGLESGEWNNPLNWTTDNTGQTSVNPCVPSPNDNVYFEAFSGNGVAGNTITISNEIAVFKNFIGNNAPNQMRFEGLSLNGFGSEINLGNDMQIIAMLNHYGSLTESQTNLNGFNSGNSFIQNINFQTSSSNYQWNINNGLKVNNDISLNGGTLNINSPSFTIRHFNMNKGIFNVPDFLNMGILTYRAGNINAFGSTIRLNRLTGSSNQYRELDIRNATINCEVDWQIFNYDSPASTILSDGSYILVGRTFQVQNGQIYNIVETNSDNEASNFLGNAFFNKLILNKNTHFDGNITTKEIEMKPRGIHLTLRQNSNQTITENMFINGSPCGLNKITGIGTGANITYLNPEDNNFFDFVEIRLINAIDSDLILGVNSSVILSNDKVIKIPGSIGVDGLGPDRYCQTNYIVSAKGFNGSFNSSYYWYKEDSLGDFIPLPVPLNTIDLDASQFGYDGTYKVVIEYDPNGLTCRNEDTVSITFAPKLVEAPNLLNYCLGTIVTLAEINLDQSTIHFMQATGAVLEWYDAPSGGNLLPDETILTTRHYYPVLKALNGCYSPVRTDVDVVFNQIPIANAGPNQTGVTGQTFVMQANNPLIGIGRWIVLSGDVYITDPASYNTTVTLVSGEIAELQWEVNNNGCIVTDDLIIGELPYTPMINPSNRIRVSK